MYARLYVSMSYQGITLWCVPVRVPDVSQTCCKMLPKMYISMSYHKITLYLQHNSLRLDNTILKGPVLPFTHHSSLSHLPLVSLTPVLPREPGRIESYICLCGHFGGVYEIQTCQGRCTFLETVNLRIFIGFFMITLFICFAIASIQEINQRGWQDMTTLVPVDP